MARSDACRHRTTLDAREVPTADIWTALIEVEAALAEARNMGFITADLVELGCPYFSGQRSENPEGVKQRVEVMTFSVYQTLRMIEAVAPLLREAQVLASPRAIKPNGQSA